MRLPEESEAFSLGPEERHKWYDRVESMAEATAGEVTCFLKDVEFRKLAAHK